MPRPTKNTGTEIFDMDLAKRIYQFRVEFVAKKQKEAAEALGVSAPYLSSVEGGSRQPNFQLVDALATKFGLNQDWLRTGLGDKRIKNPEKPTAASSLSTVHMNVLSIMKSIKVLEANLSQAFKVIERQQKQIDELTNRLNQSGR